MDIQGEVQTSGGGEGDKGLGLALTISEMDDVVGLRSKVYGYRARKWACARWDGKGGSSSYQATSSTPYNLGTLNRSRLQMSSCLVSSNCLV